MQSLHWQVSGYQNLFFCFKFLTELHSFYSLGRRLQSSKGRSFTIISNIVEISWPKLGFFHWFIWILNHLRNVFLIYFPCAESNLTSKYSIARFSWLCWWIINELIHQESHQESYSSSCALASMPSHVYG